MGQSLFKHVKSGDVGAVRKTLEHLAKQKEAIADINAYDLDGLALVHWAARLGHAEVFSRLPTAPHLRLHCGGRLACETRVAHRARACAGGVGDTGPVRVRCEPGPRGSEAPRHPAHEGYAWMRIACDSTWRGRLTRAR